MLAAITYPSRGTSLSNNVYRLTVIVIHKLLFGQTHIPDRLLYCTRGPLNWSAKLICATHGPVRRRRCNRLIADAEGLILQFVFEIRLSGGRRRSRGAARAAGYMPSSWTNCVANRFLHDAAGLTVGPTHRLTDVLALTCCQDCC